MKEYEGKKLYQFKSQIFLHYFSFFMAIHVATVSNPVPIIGFV